MSAPRKTSSRSRATGTAPPVAIASPPVGPDADPLGPLRAVVRRWPVVLAVVALTVAVAVLAALVQTPTYTAASDINVGRTDVRVQTLPGYVAGAQALAAAYSRVAISDAVVTPLARDVDLSPAAVRRRLGAAPVPDSTIFRIYGSGSSARDAIDFTRAATAQMESYVRGTDDGQRGLEDVLADYRDQARTSADLRQRIEDLKERQSELTTPPGTTTPRLKSTPRERRARSKEITRLQVALDTAQLRMQTLGGRYAERGNELAATAGVQVITRPVTATNDQHRTLQRMIALGLIGGLLLGAGLAAVVDRWRR